MVTLDILKEQKKNKRKNNGAPSCVFVFCLKLTLLPHHRMLVLRPTTTTPHVNGMQTIVKFLPDAEKFVYKWQRGCGICNDTIDAPLEREHRAACGHAYHDECLDLWTMACTVKGWDHTCPTCGAIIRILEK